MNKVINVEGQYDRGLSRAGADRKTNPELIAQSLAQIQAKPCGVLPDPAVASGEALFKDSGKILGRNAHTIIRHIQKHLAVTGFHGKFQSGIVGPVLCGIDNKLIQNKEEPLFI